MDKCKVWCLAALGLLLMGLQARNLEGMGRFCPCGEAMPRGWYLDDHPGYQPAPELNYLPGHDGRCVMCVSSITGRCGFGLCCAKTFEASSGDTVSIRATVRGNGVGWFSIQPCQGVTLQKRTFTLSDSWQAVAVTLPVSASSDSGPKNRFMVVLGAEQGANLVIAGVEASLQEHPEIKDDLGTSEDIVQVLPEVSGL